MKKIQLKVVENGLLDVPVYNENKRGKNWATVVLPDPAAPGGMARSFWAYGRGFFYYLLPPNLALQTPCVVEFAADRITKTTNRRVTNRWYGVLIDVAADALTLVECADARKAFEFLAQLKREKLSVDNREGL